MQSMYKQALTKKAPLQGTAKINRSYSDTTKFLGKSCKCENLTLSKWKREIPTRITFYLYTKVLQIIPVKTFYLQCTAKYL